MTDIGFSEGTESRRSGSRKMKIDFILAGIIRARLRRRANQILSGNDRSAGQDVVELLGGVALCSGIGLAGNDNRPRRESSAVRGHRRNLARVRLVAFDQSQLQLSAC